MDKLAEHLIEKETITGKEFVAIYEEITGEKLKRSGEEKQKEEVKELPQNEEE
jgi:cell division protease FtsH